MKTYSCLLCGINFGTRSPSKGNVLTAELCTLSDGKKAYKLLEEISKTVFKSQDLADKCFCKKCVKTCQDYYDKQKNLKTLEDEILTQFKTSSKMNLNNQESNKNKAITKDTMPSPIIIKQEKNATPNRSLLKSSRPGPIIVKQESSVTSNHMEEGGSIIVQNFNRNVASVQKSIMTIDVNKLPKGFMERFGTKTFNVNLDTDSATEMLQQNNEMTTYSTILEEHDIIEDNTQQDTTEQQSSDHEDEMETEYLLGDVEILDDDGDDDDESETILMSDSGLLRMVKGGANKFITLLNDNQDSNDDSHIELQVSGDEATTNALIEAAQQQGCTYIKVDSGEVIRVKSSGSEPGDPLGDDPLAGPEEVQQIMTYDDKVYHCQLCKNKEQSAQFSTTEASKMMNHMVWEHNTKVFICSMCDYVATRSKDFGQHMLTNHGFQQNLYHESKPLSVNKKKLVTVDKKYLLEQHKNLKTRSNKKHECTECHKRFSSKTLLDQHSNLHKGGQPFLCAVCNKTFTSKYILQSHLKIHSNRDRPYDCTLCNKAFFTIHHLTQHEKTHTDKRDFKCKTCGKSFQTRHNLEIHNVVHTKVKPFMCGVCDKAFARKAEIRDHMRTHTGERPFTCDLCQATFSQRSNLHSHKRLTHEQEKRYACDLCDKRFKRRRLLDYHSRAAHTGERPYKCDICEATFVYPDHLRKHTKLHNDVRPYGCEICGKMFNSKDNRNVHRFTHSDKKPYECLVCGVGFMRKSLLYSHMTSSGHITESIVVNQPRVSQITDGDDVPATENAETNHQEADCSVSQVISSNMPTLENKNTFIETSTEQGDPLYVTTEDGDNSSFCLTTTDVQKYITNEDGSLVRLVQVKLPGGGEGWIALQDINE